MNCPDCKTKTKLKCIDSRPLEDFERYRMYECRACGERFTSTEYLDIPEPKKHPDF